MESLNSKIYKNLPEEHKKRIIMYLTARQFKNAVLIEEMTIVPAKKNGLPENCIISFNDGLLKLTARGDKIVSKHYPFLVNKSFACEVYLKFLLLENNITFNDLKGKSGHDLLMLYNKLPLIIRQTLLKFLQNKGTPSNESLITKLKSVSQAFIQWRYIYEKFDGISADFCFLNVFCDFLDIYCQKTILEKYKYDVNLDIR